MITNYNHIVLLNDELKSFDKLKSINEISKNDSIIQNLIKKFDIKLSDKFFIKT